MRAVFIVLFLYLFLFNQTLLQAQASLKPGPEREDIVLNKNNSPVTLVEYVDFNCIFCRRVQPTLQKLEEKYPGKIQRIFRHYPLSWTPGTGSLLTHEASMCAYDQEQFWPFYHEIMSFPGIAEKGHLINFAKKLNMDVKKFEVCLDDAKYRRWIKEDRISASKYGLGGTPGFVINNYAFTGAYPYPFFEQIMESILQNDKSLLPPEIRLKAEPFKGFEDLEGKPFQGNPDAEVVLVEFSDFHCPFCSRFNKTVEDVMKIYGDKVKRYFRHFPLSFHKDAEKSHQATECAGDQNKFWEYQQALYSTHLGLKSRQGYMSLAKELGMDETQFSQCYDSGKYVDRVNEDRAVGKSLGVRGTPTLFINSQRVSGAQPKEVLVQIIESELTSSV